MRKSASEIIRELEMRIAHLEKQSARGLDKRLQEEIISSIEEEFEDDLSGMDIEFKAMSKAKAKSGKEYTLYELEDLEYYAITDGKSGYWMISEDKREAEKEMRDLKKNKHAGRNQSPQALVELGRRGRDHVNSQIFEWLGSYGDDYKQYVAVDVEDQVEFYGTYVKLNVELEYIDRADDREKSERAVFHLAVSPRSTDEESIFKAILHTDSADLQQGKGSRYASHEKYSVYTAVVYTNVWTDKTKTQLAEREDRRSQSLKEIKDYLSGLNNVFEGPSRTDRNMRVIGGYGDNGERHELMIPTDQLLNLLTVETFQQLKKKRNRDL